MGYISFIDILGTKNAAKNAEKYMRYIGDFSCAISQALQIHTGIFAYIYSDCAYLESSLLDTLINALDQIRKEEISSQSVFISPLHAVERLKLNENNSLRGIS